MNVKLGSVATRSPVSSTVVQCTTKYSRQNFAVGLRPYYAENTGSHPNPEVKLRQARLVLGWGTTLEPCVLQAFYHSFTEFFLLSFTPAIYASLSTRFTTFRIPLARHTSHFYHAKSSFHARFLHVLHMFLDARTTRK